MSNNLFFRFTGLAALISSLVSLLVAATAIAAILLPDISRLTIAVLITVADAFIFCALFGFYGVQYKQAGPLGLAGFTLALLGLPLAVVFPLLGHPLSLLGIFFLALANARTGALPVWGMWVWLAGASIAFLSALLSIGLFLAAGALISAGARAWLGSNLLRGQAASSPVMEIA